MSAECHVCGSDIVYPPGTWPIGECLVCSLRSRVSELEHAYANAVIDQEAAKELREALSYARDAMESPEEPGEEDGYDIYDRGMMGRAISRARAALDAGGERA